MKNANFLSKKYYLVCIFFTIALSQIAYNQEKDENHFFLLKNDWSAAKDMKSASYFMQVIKQDDTTYTCRYYNKFGPIIRQETFLDSGLTIAHGRFCWYDSKGNLDSTAWVILGKKINWTYFDDSLKPAISIRFANGRIVERRDYRLNAYTDASGTISNLAEKEKSERIQDNIAPGWQYTQASFNDATPKEEWNNYFKKNIKLPERFFSIFKKGIYPLTVSFIVNKEGKTEDVYLVQSCEWSADNEVLKAVQQTPSLPLTVNNDDMTRARQLVTVAFAPAYQSNENSVANILSVAHNSIIVTQGSMHTEAFIDTANFYSKNKLQDNFYLHVNGNWIIDHPLPQSRSSWSNLDILRDLNMERLNELYRDAAAQAPDNSVARLLGDLYLSGMDTVLIESKGITPVKEELEQIETLADKNNILEKVAQMRSIDGINDCLFRFTIKNDDRNPDKYIVAFYQSGITLPVKTYYTAIDGRSQYVRNAYSDYVRDMFKLAGFDKRQANHKADQVLELETAISNALVTGDDIMDPEKAYHKYAIRDFVSATNIDWIAILNKLEVNAKLTDSILVNSPPYFKYINNLINDYPLDDWIAYLQWKLIYNSAFYLNEAILNRAFAFSKVLDGQDEQVPRWQRITSMTDAMMYDISGKLFTNKYFPDSTKERVIQLVNNLKAAFAERIKNLSWLSDGSKQEALEKLYVISKNIGCDQSVSDYKGLVIRKDDFVGNIRNIRHWHYQKMINRLSMIEDEDYTFSAATVNAFYNPQENAIYLPAGILQSPFFDANADDAINYGAIGSIIGHELTHGFDTRGNRYDKDGRLLNWWTREDASNFEKKTDEIIDQFDKLRLGGGIYVNGALTVNENIADMGGLDIAYDAFKRTAQGKGSILIDGLTPDQRFFMSYAQNWRSSTTAETTYQDNMIEPHAPDMYRCNVPLSNLDAFYQAFNIHKGDGMFRPANKRVVIW